MSYLYFVLFLTISSLICVQSEIVSWKSSVSGKFSDPTKWDKLRVPGPNDDVRILANGTYYVLLDEPVTLNSLSLNKQNGCTCFECRINLIIQAPLTVTTNVTAYSWTNIFIVNTTLDGSVILSSYSGLYGSGVVTGNVTGNGAVIGLHSFKALTQASKPLTASVLATFTINGKLVIADSGLMFDINGNVPITTMDALYVDGGVTATSSRVLLRFGGGLSPTYGVAYQILFSPKITANFTLETSTISSAYNISTQVCVDLTIPTTTGITKSVTLGVQGASGDGTMTTTTSSTTVNTYCQSDGYAFLLTPPTQVCCPTGWTGTTCEVPICPGEPDCSNHGTCNTFDLNIPPFCECDSGYSGVSCLIETLCSEYNYCSNHGSCGSAQKCVCDNGWIGANCSVPVCPGAPQCSGKGLCNIITNTPICDCFNGYTGTECEVVLEVAPGECNMNCSGHGSCNNGTCECIGDWTGSACNIAVCSGTETNCNGKGKCVPRNQTSNYCECLQGWSGDNCTVASCTNDCSGRGQCVTTGSTVQCDCAYPFFGDDCSFNEVQLNSENPTKEKVSYGLIAGVTGGVLAVTAVSATVGFILLKKKQQKRRNLLKSPRETVLTGNSSH